MHPCLTDLNKAMGIIRVMQKKIKPNKKTRIQPVAFLPTAFYFEGIPNAPQIGAIAGILYLAIFPTALATLLLTVLINRAGPSFLSLVNYQVPIWSMFFGAWVLSEALPVRFYIALALILTGMAISQWFSLRKVLLGR